MYIWNKSVKRKLYHVLMAAINLKQEVSLKKIIIEGYRAVGSLNDSFHSSNFLLLVFFIDFSQW